MKRTLKYFFSLLLVCSWFSGTAQFEDDELPRRQVFVRVGYDLSRLALPYVREIGSHGMEFSVDAELHYNFFPVVEFGRQSLKHNTDSLRYKMAGEYARIGLDYNLLKYKHRLDRDIFFLGFRFAGTKFTHEAPYAVVSGVWGVSTDDIPASNISAYWGEAVVGVKGELLKNLYIGLTVRAKMMFSHTDYKSMTPYIVPGYGKGFNRFNAGLSYSIMYAIPIRSAGSDGYELEE
ncbi:MAG: hypothetical protein J6W13_14915 [Salinivirgaceae bacterium]|nr:hypothetical protein [Salinivirgaceae bacterium]